MPRYSKILAVILLGIAGFAGNWLRYPLFLNIDFLFGSFFVMVTLFRYGLCAGVTVNLIASSATFFLWSHPYAMIIFTAETLFVGILNRRRQKSDILLHDIAYWLFLGIPLVWFFYHHILGDTFSSTLLIVLKQAMNGIFNALLASLYLLIKSSREKTPEKLPSLQNVVFTLMVVLVLVPAFFLIFWNLRTESANRVKLLAIQTTRSADAAHASVSAWLKQHQQTVTSLANRIGDPDKKNFNEMQEIVETIKDATSDFWRMGVLNKNAVTLSYVPLKDEVGNSTLGISFADRPYIPFLKEHKKPYIAGLMLGKFGRKGPVIPLLTPIIVDNEFKGYCVGVLQSGVMKQQLETIVGSIPMDITVIDQFGQVVVSTRNDLHVMSRYSRPLNGTINQITSDITHWIPPPEKGKNLMQRWGKSKFVAEREISIDSPWKIIVENSYDPLLADLRNNAVTSLLGLILLTLMTVPVSYHLSHLLTRSLELLRESSRTLPEDINRNKQVSLPESSILEIACLIENFREASVALQVQHNALQQLNEKLELAHSQLEKQVLERTKDLEKALNSLKSEMSERLQAVEELRTKERMLIQQNRLAAMGEMISNIAHQWRQPLNTLGLIIQRLPIFYGTDMFNKEFVTETSSDAMKLVNHMSATIDDFRNFFKPEKERIDFSLNKAINQAVSLVEVSFRSHRLQIALHMDGDPVVNGYPNEFSQVIMNILFNARDAIIENRRENGMIAIRSGKEDERVIICISDNAGGIPEEIVDSIFDPYFTTKGPDRGTGIGLFMSKVIIEQNLGGHLSVRNTSEGAEFRIEI